VCLTVLPSVPHQQGTHVHVKRDLLLKLCLLIVVISVNRCKQNGEGAIQGDELGEKNVRIFKEYFFQLACLT
jgi:hypothetical protein